MDRTPYAMRVQHGWSLKDSLSKRLAITWATVALRPLASTPKWICRAFAKWQRLI